MLQFRNVAIEQVHGGFVVVTTIAAFDDNMNPMGQRVDRYAITDKTSAILEIVQGFLNITPPAPELPEDALAVEDASNA